MKKIFYIVRYSVLHYSNAWILSKESATIEQYATALFDEKRLNLKFDFFSNLTLPSVAAQKRENTNCSHEVVVFTSDELPTEHMKKLMSLSQEIAFTIIPVKRDQNYARICNEYIKKQFLEAEKDALYATVRLDDDDVLADTYEQRLSSYLTPLNDDYVVTFPLGYESYFTISNNKCHLENTLNINFKKIALGLAHIGQYNATENSFSSKTLNIYQTGNHTKVDERFNVIYDMTPRMYLRVSYEMQDTKGAGYRKRLKQAASIPPEEVKLSFPLVAQYM